MQHQSGNSRDMVVRNQSSDRRQLGPGRRFTAVLTWVAGVTLALSPLTGYAGGESHSGKKGSIVAAGFGYQNGSESVITVKVYDAQSGQILSDDVYELSVKEDSSFGASPRERIFAGGVGGGRDRSL